MLRGFALLVLAATLPAAGESFYSHVYPPDPVEGESIILTTCDEQVLEATSVAVGNGAITFSAPRPDGGFGYCRRVASASPALASGRYDVNVRLGSINPSVTTVARIDVPPNGVFAPAHRGLSGNWHPPAELGWGVNVIQGASGGLFAAWMGNQFDAGPSPVWLVMPGGKWLSPTEFRGLLYFVDGTPLAKPWNAADMRPEPYGFMKLTFTGLNEAQLDATIFSFGLGTHYYDMRVMKTLRKVQF